MLDSRNYIWTKFAFKSLLTKQRINDASSPVRWYIDGHCIWSSISPWPQSPRLHIQRVGGSRDKRFSLYYNCLIFNTWKWIIRIFLLKAVVGHFVCLHRSWHLLMKFDTEDDIAHVNKRKNNRNMAAFRIRCSALIYIIYTVVQ